MDNENKRRSKLEIMLTVLSAVKGLLDMREVPRGNRSIRRYEITEKGLNVLAYFNEANALLNIT